ncbi:MAG: NADH-quinone oxidoreductase subunit NuoE [Pseudomonadota bacterium]
MAVRRLHHEQPDSFAFTAENEAWARETIAKYPSGKEASAVIPLLWRGQEQEGWTTEPMIEHISEMLGMAKIRVLEVATFYTMFQLSPVGRKAHIQVCGTTPCMLRGAEDLKEVCRKRINASPHQLSDDGAFSWEEVECLGACVNAPLVQIQKDTFEDLTASSLEAILDTIDKGQKPRPGPQVDRQLSAPAGEHTALTSPPRGPLGEGGFSGADGSGDAALDVEKNDSDKAEASGRPGDPIETAEAVANPGKSEAE